MKFIDLMIIGDRVRWFAGEAGGFLFLIDGFILWLIDKPAPTSRFAGGNYNFCIDLDEWLHHYGYFDSSIFNNSASSITGTESFVALANLEPALSPATK